MRLFWERGFGAVSLPELEARTGLARSSLYNSFGSKQEIFAQALARYRAAMGEQICRPLESGEHGLADLLSFLDRVSAQFAGESGSTGCLMVNSMVEFGGADDTVKRHSGEHFERLRQALIAALKRAVALGEIPPGNLPEKADLILGLLLGISVASRAGLARREVAAMVGATRAQIQAWAVAPAKRGRLP